MKVFIETYISSDSFFYHFGKSQAKLGGGERRERERERERERDRERENVFICMHADAAPEFISISTLNSFH
jgi:hypothetical protein